MKINFDLTVGNLISIAIGIALLISLFAKPVGMSKSEAKELHEQFYINALAIGKEGRDSIMKRLSAFDSLSVKLEQSELLQVKIDKDISNLDKQLKRVKNEFTINWSDSSTSAVSKFLADRIKLSKDR